MTTAAWWWWAKDKEAVSTPPTVNPPILVDPAEQDIWEGKVYDMYVDNVGGAAESWVVDWLPNGLSSEGFGSYLHITGTVGALRPPVVTNPGQQNWYVGESIDLTINLDLTTGDPADTITAIPLISGLSITESSQSHIRITGVAGIPIIDPADVQDRTYYQGQSFDFEIANIGDGAATWLVDQLPTGLSWEEVDGFTLRIYGTVGGIVAPPVISDPGAQTGTVGEAFTLQMSATNSPTSWSAINLPDGLTIDNSGLISGTPTTEESPTASITATNAGGDSNPQDVAFTISVVPVVNPVSDQTVTIGDTVNLAVTASQGTLPITWSEVGLPTGLSIADTGTATTSITGTVGGTSGTYPSTVTATNVAGSDDEAIEWTVNDVPLPPVINPTTPQLAEVNQSHTYQLSASNSPTSWDDGGTLPTGLSIDNAGLISGTPTVQGFSTASVTATNAAGTSDAVTIDYTVHGAATDLPSLIDPGDQTVTVGVPYSIVIRNVGGPVDLPDGWDVRVGWLPDGLTSSSPTAYSLTISGTPVVPAYVVVRDNS